MIDTGTLICAIEAATETIEIDRYGNKVEINVVNAAKLVEELYRIKYNQERFE
jgi:hypothetical protein